MGVRRARVLVREGPESEYGDDVARSGPQVPSDERVVMDEVEVVMR